ncbi:Actin cortical patch SUR7/pH-response regulator PalI [Rhypophila sp. PSN 637]
MARTGFFHHIGTFLLLSATILLIVTCISAPVVNNIALLHVDFGDNSRSSFFDRTSVNFGTFGWCETRNDAPDDCTNSRLGYSPYTAITRAMGNNGENIDDSDIDLGGIDDDGNVRVTNDGDRAAAVTTRKLTKAMILHPIACGLNFIAFMLALGAGMVGSLLASMVALLAFLTTAVIMIIDFVMFSIVRSHVDDWTGGADNRGTTGNGLVVQSHYGAAAWTTLASAICSLLGTIVVFFTCCSGRLHKRRQSRGVAAGPKTDYGVPVTTRRRKRFGIF